MPSGKTKIIDPQYIHSLYRAGVEFKNSIDLYATADRNERFFAGDQWAGVNAPDLPKPVVNFIKRAVQQRVAEVNSNPVSVAFDTPEYPAETAIPGKTAALSHSDTAILNTMFETDWNRMKMNAKNLDGLLDAAVSGDYILYNYWDSAAKTGQDAMGQICAEVIDNVNFYPGNPNITDVQKQPYIIITRRELLSDVIKEAAAGGLSETEIQTILSDKENLLQSGDVSRHELSGSENSKCLTFTYLFKGAEGFVFAERCAGNIVVRPLWNTKLTRYPIALMNWERRKGSIHGRSEIAGLIPVQRYINQMYAMAMLFTMQSALPKAVFNQGMVKSFSNAIGSAIPVNGDINAAVKYLDPPALSGDVYSLPERLMATTLQMLGVTNIELGSVNPTNTSAIVLAREASSMPVNSIKERYYSLIADFARNWLDMVTAYATVPRWVKCSNKEGTKLSVFDPTILKDRIYSIRVDVGAASAFSEINSVTTLNSLFASGVIDAREYIERLPNGYLPMREKLLTEIEENKTEEKRDG